jgi:peptidoglycan/LPS O-acetylase OafA/YrhL
VTGPDGAATARPGRFPLVDSLRAIAALLIVAYHAAFVLGGLEPDGPGRWLAHLNVGVPLFFAISGFLLYRPFVAARVRGLPSPSLRAYALRRVARIAPAYWVALTIVAVALAREEVFDGPHGLVTYYGFAQAYGADSVTGGIGQAWTLSVEVAFYVALPLALLAPVRGARGQWRLIGAIVAASVAWKLIVATTADPAGDAYFPLLVALPGAADLFAAGMALAVLSAGPRPPGRLQALVGRRPALPWLAALAAFALLGTDWPAEGPTATLLRDRALEAVVVLGLLAPAVIGADGGGAVRRLLAQRWLAWIGLVSYGVYLWHLDVLRELEGAGLPGPAVVTLGVAGSLALGAASWYGLERHAIRLGRRASGRPPVAPRAGVPAPAAAESLVPSETRARRKP